PEGSRFGETKRSRGGRLSASASLRVELRPEPRESDMTQAALRVRNLRKTYKDVIAVGGLDRDVPARECFGLLGPNGAGKTTDHCAVTSVMRREFTGVG